MPMAFPVILLQISLFDFRACDWGSICWLLQGFDQSAYYQVLTSFPNVAQSTQSYYKFTCVSLSLSYMYQKHCNKTDVGQSFQVSPFSNSYPCFVFLAHLRARELQAKVSMI